MGIVIPIIKIDIECIDLIMVIHFMFSVTGSKQARMALFSQKVSLGLVQTLEFLTISGCGKEQRSCSVTFSKLVDFLSLHLQCRFPRDTTRDIDTAALKPIV